MFVDGVSGASTAARCWTGRPSLPQTDGSDCLELSPPPVTSRQGNDRLYLLGCEQSTGVRGFFAACCPSLERKSSAHSGWSVVSRGCL
jgi:hypothetical protein